MNLRVAAYQFPTSGNPRWNLHRIEKAMKKAGRRGVRFLVLPECCLSGYLPDPGLDYRLVHRLVGRIRRLCRGLRLGLALGTAVRTHEGLFNRAILISPIGSIIGTYDKAALTGWGDVGVFEPGREIRAFRLDGISFGVQICYDMRYPENWRILRRQGVRVVFLLVNASMGAPWKRPVMTGTAACRAAENGFFVVAANDARAPQMMVSSIHDPDGTVLAEAAPDAEELIVADLDLSPQREWLGDRIWRERPVHVWGADFGLQGSESEEVS